MPNPFLVKRSYAIPYATMWILITGIHVVVLYYLSQQELVSSLIDAMIYNGLYAGVGLSVWFAVRYHDHTKALPDILIYYLATGVLAVALWLAAGYFLLKISLPDFEQYKLFLDSSIPWRVISGFFFYALLVLIYILHMNSEEQKRRKAKEDALQLRIREAEIDRLKAQINPHFLFNSLNSISSLTLAHPESAREMLVKLSSFLRYSLEFNENQLTDLTLEIEHIQQYLEIEKVRFGDRLQFEFALPEDCARCQVPNMILQPLFENAIKHGVYESIEPVFVKTSVHLADAMLVIQIRNSFDPEVPPRKGKGIGLQNVSNRMRLIYQAENLVHISKTDRQFDVTLYVPQNVQL